MSKVTIATISNLQNEPTAVSQINANFTAIQNAIDLLLSRDGTSPNAMVALLDMNNHRVINLPVPVDYTDAARHGELQLYVDNAEAAQEAAEIAQGLAEVAQAGAESAEQGAALSLVEFEALYLGAKASDPTVDNEGQPLQEGALYFNTVLENLRVYDNGIWVQGVLPTTGIVFEAPNDGVLYGRKSEAWSAVPDKLVINNQTDDYTLAADDTAKYVRVAKATAVDVTIPLNTTVAIPVGASVVVRQADDGQVTLVPEGGVTINTAETLLLRKNGSTVTLIKVATDEWDVIGDLEAA